MDYDSNMVPRMRKHFAWFIADSRHESKWSLHGHLQLHTVTKYMQPNQTTKLLDKNCRNP